MRQLCMGILVVLLIGSQFHFSETSLLAAEYSKPQGWDQLVEAARKEGVVAIYGRTGEHTEEVLRDFEKAYPGIQVLRVSLPGARLLSRLMAEYRARKYLADVVFSGSAVVALKPAGVLASLKSALILPEVVDTSAWRDNRLWWFDAAEPYTTLNFQGISQAYLTYNTNLVNPKEFTSWMDLLNPKWKGKIVSVDMRRSAWGGGFIRFIYQHPDLGPRYLERFYGEMDVALSARSRLAIDWVGVARFHIGLGIGSNATEQAAAQGLPVALVATQHFKEGADMTAGGGAISVTQHPPHPNAAKLFVNWLLSREGQMAWQRRTTENSLRIDIPKEGLNPKNTPIPGQTYFFTSTEEKHRARKEVNDFMRRLLGQLGK